MYKAQHFKKEGIENVGEYDTSGDSEILKYLKSKIRINTLELRQSHQKRQRDTELV